MRQYCIDLVLPVHNEAETIRQTIQEFFAVAQNSDNIKLRFVICEDGSTDNTVEVINKAAEEFPIIFLTSKTRKGYSRAVIDGFNSCEAEYIAFSDSDGQCDPSDLIKLLNKVTESDVAFGQRMQRTDSTKRRAMSFAFRCVFRLLFNIKIKDPSCPYLIMRREVWNRIKKHCDIGMLPQGFWWEFVARITSENFKIIYVPVRHRPRAGGETKVYKSLAIPKIAAEHLIGLFRLKYRLRKR
jgi:glycosyltransferase involved in cell wall biosynthesis